MISHRFNHEVIELIERKTELEAKTKGLKASKTEFTSQGEVKLKTRLVARRRFLIDDGRHKGAVEVELRLLKEIAKELNAKAMSTVSIIWVVAHNATEGEAFRTLHFKTNGRQAVGQLIRHPDTEAADALHCIGRAA